jgi:predicted metal-dependent HD superfamily phosphohydrolase
MPVRSPNVTAEEQEYLQAEWERTLRAAGAEAVDIRQAFLELARHYDAPDRHYHTLAHLRDVLSIIESLHDQARNLPAIELAAWFHDVIYDPRSQDNEERSAAYAQAMLEQWQVAGPLIQQVSRLILATKHHQVDADDVDGQILLDADLAILGAEDARYADYARAIRQEYAWVADEAYRIGRRKVLQSFLRRERIYLMDSLHATREAPARRNLQSEIDALS